MSGVRNITVPWVPLDEFDWSFARSGPIPWNLTVWSLLAVFTALPIWTTVELTVWVLYTFERWRGIYFWSVLGTTWGVTIHAVGFVLKFCVPEANWIFSTVLCEIGWVGMVSGFSMVLWSRLHLVLPSHTRTLRVVLAVIIVDAVLFHTPTIVFQFLVSNKPTHEKFLPYMEITERIQIMAFSAQEIAISAIYVWGTLQLLKLSLNAKAKTTLAFLIIVQVIVVLADVLVIVLDYVEYFTLKAVLHSFVYAFKLQVEFVVLNEFKHIAQGGITGAGGSLGGGPDGIRSLNNAPLDMPKTINCDVHNDSGVMMAMSGTVSPSSRGARSDVSRAQTEHMGEPDAIERQYLGRYGGNI
ncbi:hypothetical protein F5Y04DRAFT_287813 [Hypomontagnella monticulosa]|nr:hypothetical protein F5Y04DRAFT_287813 [Hypomontagnella monticulosa]